MMSQKRDQIAVKQFAQEVFSRYFENVVAEKSTFGYSMGILTALESQSEVIYEYLLAKQPKLATLVALKLKKRE